MIDESDFVERIRAAVFNGRRKLYERGQLRRPWRGEHYERLTATIYAQDVAHKLPELFRPSLPHDRDTPGHGPILAHDAQRPLLLGRIS